MATLVLVEHDNVQIKPSTLATVTAARQLQQPIHCLVAGHQCTDVVAQAAKIAGVDKVLVADAPSYTHGLAENVAALVVEQSKNHDYLLAPASTFGKNIMPRVAALLGVAQISDVITILSSDTFVRPIYAGNALQTVQSLDTKKILTVRPTAFDMAVLNETATASSEILITHIDMRVSRFEQQISSTTSRPELANASIIVAGGRGLQSGENFKLLEELADVLGAAIGASRAAVDAGFVPNDYQVGQTGKVVAPQLYIAIGISGAIQHLAGMKESKVIVAINKDPDAPIFQVADYGLVGDLFEIVPALIETLKQQSQ